MASPCPRPQKSQALRVLQLFNNMSDNAGAEHIARVLARAPCMEDFRMASSRVGPSGGIALAQGLMAGERCASKQGMFATHLCACWAGCLARTRGRMVDW